MKQLLLFFLIAWLCTCKYDHNIAHKFRDRCNASQCSVRISLFTTASLAITTLPSLIPLALGSKNTAVAM